ncbi:hypothetical protein GA0070606_5876 [Micromonospora citrea]|uniref:Uncharacterized protein n=1 Tax=Micromonospora citrea TaxID=47855 RepID=A0A1C6W000_9ACTN|nr:hypothetical protein [Micromonospora citrea]SCL71911.1 hypothetical protein GA0070606_5876 [Micromonospora citrea]
MTDSHPPYGGQPDPNVTPWSGPPAPPAGYPGYGQPGQPPQFGAPVPPPQKSNKGLIIGLSAAAVVVLLVLCGGGIGFLLVNNDDDDPTPIASATANPTAGNPGPDTSTSPSPEQSESEQPNSNNAVTARYSSDLGDVCEGSQILNAAPYNGPSGAKAYVFSNNPDRPTFWSSKTIASNKPYYARSAQFETVSVVGCLKFVEGSEGTPKKCQYTSSGKQVTIDYVSSRYTLTFHAAKTGEKIGDGGTVSAPASRCPSFISYNKNTMKAYASPDAGTVEAALDKFLA